MRYKLSFCLSIFLLGLLAVSAQAGPKEDGAPKGDRPLPHLVAGGPEPLDPARHEAAIKMFRAYQEEIEPLRTELHAKSLQLNALAPHPGVDQKVIVELANDVAKLHSDLRKKHREFQDKCLAEFGPEGHKYFRRKGPAGFWMHDGLGPMHPGPALPPGFDDEPAGPGPRPDSPPAP